MSHAEIHSLEDFELIPVDGAEMAVMGILNEAYALLDRIKGSPDEFKRLALELQEASAQLYRAALMARGVTNATAH